MFSSSVAEHVQRAIWNAPLNKEPFPFFYARDVFPADFYAAMLRELPGDGDYKASAYDCRSMILQNHLSSFWSPLVEWLMDEFTDKLITKFLVQIKKRFPGDCEVIPNMRLVRDTDGYAIKPHTDHPAKVLSLLFYLPADDSLKDYGTALYRPNDPDFRDNGRGRYPFENFSEVWRAPFLPNTCLGFFKTDQAFHGVPQIHQPGMVRNVLLHNVYDTAFSNELKRVP